MGRLRYLRDLPDGSRQYFLHRMEPLESGQPYFDDQIQQIDGEPTQVPLEFLFFGKEQSYPNRVLKRKTNEYILHYVTGGEGTFNGRTVRAGEGFLTVPGVMHRMASDSSDPWRFKWIAFRGRDAKWQMKSIGLDEEHPYFSFHFSRHLEELFDEVIYGEHEDCDLNTYLQGVFYIILSYHKKQYREESRYKGAGGDYAREAVRYMDEHFREDLRAEALAEKLHISRKYLCAVLEEHIGMSTKEYLLMRRLECAAHLLRYTGMTISEIAAQVGYGDYTQLSRLFRQRMGVSPQQFRKGERMAGVSFTLDRRQNLYYNNKDKVKDV
ncbi:MAG: AraC family transcriptional regulator [Clostridia bacterium]|nr:AraC family transcriptional regulator [Clostridia bacterium]